MKKYGATIYLKREDLNHTGAHKINNVIGQILRQKRRAKQRLLPRQELTAWCCNSYGSRFIIWNVPFTWEKKILNDQKLKCISVCRGFGATVLPVTTGSATLKDAN